MVRAEDIEETGRSTSHIPGTYPIRIDFSEEAIFLSAGIIIVRSRIKVELIDLLVGSVELKLKMRWGDTLRSAYRQYRG